MIKIKVCKIEYEIQDNSTNLLDAFIDIKKTNKSLGFKFGCKSGVCGSCAVRVNGIEKLACISKIIESDEILPLKNLPILNDLIVDDSNIKAKLLQASASLNKFENNKVSSKEVDIIDLQSKCILCNSCYSSCPVYEVNTNFIGPFALTRAYRYIHDSKESNTLDKLDSIQSNGVWDCTLCGTCSLVCPQGIDIKNDIMKLQNDSVQAGYENPTFSTNNSFASFDSEDFGFNPNSF